MTGAVFSIAIVASAAALTAGLAAIAGGAVVAQRLAGAADAAALAAADAASGAATGVPCQRAEEVAGASGVSLLTCDLDELIATVTVGTRYAGLSATASARAGPPGGRE